MKKNVGQVDRIIRIIIGIILIAFSFTDVSYHQIGYIGIIPILTGILGFCPLYTLFGK